MPSSVDLLRKYADIIDEADLSQQTDDSGQAKIDPKVAAGAQAVGKFLGGDTSGAMVAKGLDKASQGQSITGQLSQAIAPFIKPLEKILADPVLKQQFLNLIKRAQ